MRASPARARRVHGISTRIATNATTPIGRLIRKIHRHVETSVIQPPSVGPITDAIPNTPATAPCTRPRSSGEYRSAMTAMVVAKMSPAPMPCSARAPISASIEGRQARGYRGDHEGHDRHQEQRLAAEQVPELPRERQRDRRR